MNSTAVIAFLTAVILSRLVPPAARFGCFESERQKSDFAARSRSENGCRSRNGRSALRLGNRATPGNAALAVELQHRLRMTKPTGWSEPRRALLSYSVPGAAVSRVRVQCRQKETLRELRKERDSPPRQILLIADLLIGSDEQVEARFFRPDQPWNHVVTTTWRLSISRRSFWGVLSSRMIFMPRVKVPQVAPRSSRQNPTRPALDPL